jgi:hypothetical protein
MKSLQPTALWRCGSMSTSATVFSIVAPPRFSEKRSQLFIYTLNVAYTMKLAVSLRRPSTRAISER